MKIWLDDIRPEPAEWLRCYTAEQVMDVMEMATPDNPVTHLALDYHLGTISTGATVLEYVLNNVLTYNIAPPANITVHTSDPGAAQRMRAMINDIKLLAERKD